MAIPPKLVPQWSDDKTLPEKRFMRVLLLGAPKQGKTVAAVGTSPGPVYVINSDQKDSLDPVSRIYPNAKYAKNLIHTQNQMEDAIVLARKLVNDGEIKTIVWDTISGFAHFLEDEFEDKTRNEKGESDGRRFWRSYTKYILNVVGRLSKLDAHLVVCSHYIDINGQNDVEGIPKTGPGIVPLLAGQLRARIGAYFPDILFMEKVKGSRAFVTGIDGVWGPGCRSINDNKVLPADFKEFMKAAGISK